MSIEILIAILSATVAVASAVFAWQTARSAEKTYSMELLSQLYTIYQSSQMLNDLRIVWNIYRQLWLQDSSSEEAALKKIEMGTPVRLGSAVRYFNELDVDSTEYKAIHNVINFWTYLELLLKKKVINPQDITAFTSSRILGVLSPLAKAYDLRYMNNYDKETSLEYSYKVLQVRRNR